MKPCSAELLTELFAAIKKGRRGGVKRFYESVKSGWVHMYQINDLGHDLGLHGWMSHLMAQAEIGTTTIFYRPRRIANSASGGDGVRIADMASFLKYLERLGLNVDPEPLVGQLLPEISKLPCVTKSELHLLWYTKERHKTVPIRLMVEGYGYEGRQEQFKTTNGYKVIGQFVGDEIHCLEINAPRYRRTENSLTESLITCEVCGIEWLKGDSASSLDHRREHKKRLAILEPTPNPHFIAALADEADPELVTTNSPTWKHKAIYGRAVTFRREFGYDFVQWGSPDGDNDPKVHGFLFNDDTGVFGHGAIAGACAFRWREYTDHPACWAMQWIWIAPKTRRHGILSRHWPIFRERFGDFVLEHPLSEAMQAFATKHGID